MAFADQFTVEAAAAESELARARAAGLDPERVLQDAALEEGYPLSRRIRAVVDRYLRSDVSRNPQGPPAG